MSEFQTSDGKQCIKILEGNKFFKKGTLNYLVIICGKILQVKLLKQQGNICNGNH